MENLSPEELWAAAHEQMLSEVQARISLLMTKNNFGTITDEEQGDQRAYH